MAQGLKIVVFGLSLTSSWGNGHATTYRALLSGLAKLGHHVLFLEYDQPWYAQNRDLISPSYSTVRLYSNLHDMRKNFAETVRDADLVIVGSYVADGARLGKWVVNTARGVTAFYDIDTPVTLSKLENGGTPYITRDLLPRYDLYLSFTSGPVLRCLERRYGASMARPLYCSVDPELYVPRSTKPAWDLGYMGTYSRDRQPSIESLLLRSAQEWPDGRFVLAGSQYPGEIRWPHNLEYKTHVSPADHPSFYAAQRFTLNLTRCEMRAQGYSPSVRLFEAAACGTPIITDDWPGLECFFIPDSEILIARNSRDVLDHLQDISEEQRKAIAKRARTRVLQEHTGLRRAAELIGYFHAVTRSRVRSLDSISEQTTVTISRSTCLNEG